MPSGNPVFKESTFLDLGSGSVIGRDGGIMSLSGTVNKTGILLMLTAIAAAFAWSQVIGLDGRPTSSTGIFMLVGAIGGFILALATTFRQQWSPITAPLYAMFEGVFLGSISAVFETRYHGVVIQAVMLTFATMLAMLFAYRSGLIRVTDKFKLGVMAATGGIALFYLVSSILGLFHVSLPILHGSGTLSIIISLFIVGIAALNLVIDFDFIERAVAARPPKYMEWYAAFGLMVTLVWLYIEILRLLTKLQSRD